MIDEKWLVSSAKHGNTTAFEEIVKLYQNEVYNSAYFITKNREDALDVSQEVFLKLWRSLSSYREEASLKTYIAKITRNCALDYLRTRTKNEADALYYEDGNTVEIPDTDSSPSVEYEKEERRRAVRNAISELPSPYKEAIVMREISGLSYDEIAKATLVSVGTVKSRISRGREELKKILKTRNIL